MKKSINTKVLPLALAISSALFTQQSFAQQTQGDEEIEVIQVSGIRSSLTESMDLKKNAMKKLK